MLNPIGIVNTEDGIYDKTKKSKKSQNQNTHTHSHHTKTLIKKLSMKLPDEVRIVKFDEKQILINQYPN